MEIKNLTKAAKRIAKAVKNKERIILYGDTDLDGVCSVLVLKEAIQSSGAQIAKVYFPNREKEGYGLTFHALEELKGLAPALLVIMDMGITSFQEVEAARKSRLEVIVLDHHEVVEKLPKANIVVDPKQPLDLYAFKGLAACGVTFRLAEKLLAKALSPLLRKSLIELVAIATIADMMPREDENVSLIDEGLQELKDPLRPAIRALFCTSEFVQFQAIEMKVTQMISMLNVRNIEQGLPASYRFFTSPSEAEALAMVPQLLEQSKLRKEQVRNVAEVVREKIKNFPAASCIVEGDPSFEPLVLGSVASIIAQECEKPVFLYKMGGSESMGTVRAPSGYNTVEAMNHCAALLLTYGGHAKASGFRIRNENIVEFKQCLEKYFSDNPRKTL